MPHYHFISGLYRSGSTLLAAILRQNLIGEPLFEHDFKNVEYDAPEFDFQLEARAGTAFDPRWNFSQGVRLFPRFVREVLSTFFLERLSDIQACVITVKPPERGVFVPKLKS